MKEIHLIIIVFILALAGVFSLYIISNSMDYKEISIDDKGLEGLFKIKGEVVGSINLGNITILEIMQPKTIKVVMFGSNTTFLKGEMLEIIGSEDEYNGQREIIAQYVRVIS